LIFFIFYMVRTYVIPLLSVTALTKMMNIRLISPDAHTLDVNNGTDPLLSRQPHLQRNSLCRFGFVLPRIVLIVLPRIALPLPRPNALSVCLRHCNATHPVCEYPQFQGHAVVVSQGQCNSLDRQCLGWKICAWLMPTCQILNTAYQKTATYPI